MAAILDFRANGPLRTELEIVFIGFLQIKVPRKNPENVMPVLRFAVDGLFMVYTLSSNGIKYILKINLALTNL